MTSIESVDRQNDQDQLDFPVMNVLLSSMLLCCCFLPIGTKFLTTWL